MANTGMSLYCKSGRLNWACLPEFPLRLKKHGLESDRFSAALSRYPLSAKFSEIDAVVQYVKEKGEPHAYDLHFKNSTALSSSLDIFHLFNVHNQEVLSINIEGFGNEDALKEFAAFLGLEPDYSVKSPVLERTAFIAHRFDQKGMDLADRLARFLTLLGFTVKTGRAFAPKSVAEKVMERLKSQHFVFVILTPGDDDTWLIQESTLQHKDKPLFLLRDQGAGFKPGLLADQEFIPFQEGHFESVYLPILEGLKELGYLRYAK